MTEEKQTLSKKEEEEYFRFDNKTLDDYDDDALIDKGDYLLEVVNFKRGVKILIAGEISQFLLDMGYKPGDKVGWASFIFGHKKDKNDKLDPKMVGRRHDLFFYGLERESVRAEISALYQYLGHEGAYQPKYDKAEFIRNAGQNNEVRASNLFYIGKYQDSKTKRDLNTSPKLINNAKTKRQEKADAKGPVEI